ncbi:MAG: hypothetical protein Q9190_002704 [Brigantiaea leucoxantha]
MNISPSVPGMIPLTTLIIPPSNPVGSHPPALASTPAQSPISSSTQHTGNVPPAAPAAQNGAFIGPPALQSQYQPPPPPAPMPQTSWNTTQSVNTAVPVEELPRVSQDQADREPWR